MPADFTIRAARATDSEAAVPLIYSSGPAAFDYVFSRSDSASPTSSGAPPDGAPLEFLHRAFMDGSGEFGYRTHWIAQVASRIVGVGAGYSGADALAFTLAAARQIVAHYGLLAGIGVIRRGLAVERVVPPPMSRSLFYIGHLGIAADLRGGGFGGLLIEHLLQRGREAGFRQVALDVSCANPRAQSLYERIGFRVAAEHRSTLSNRFASVPDHRRMTMAL